MKSAISVCVVCVSMRNHGVCDQCVCVVCVCVKETKEIPNAAFKKEFPSCNRSVILGQNTNSRHHGNLG